MMNRNCSAVREVQNERSEWMRIVKRADLVNCHSARSTSSRTPKASQLDGERPNIGDKQRAE